MAPKAVTVAAKAASVAPKAVTVAAKGNKRKDGCSSGPQPKKIKTCPMISAVCAVVESAELQDSCRDMLVGAIPASFECYADERHEIQRLVVEMVGEVVEQTRAKLQGKLDESRGNVAELNGVQNNLKEKISEAESCREKALQELDARNIALAEAAAGESEATRNLESANETARSGDAAAAVTAGNLDVLRKAIETELPPLIAVEDDAALPTADTVRATVAPLLKHLVLDQSLVIALPSACAKKQSERGAFDKMVIEGLMEAARVKASALSADVEQEASAAKERAEAVEAAKQMLDAKANGQRAASQEVESATQTVRDGETGVTRATEVDAEHQPSLEAAKATLLQDEADMQNFEAYTFECFKLIRDKKKVAPVSSNAEADAPQSEAAAPTSVEVTMAVDVVQDAMAAPALTKIAFHLDEPAMHAVGIGGA